MMLAGFTGLGLGAASLAFASIPDVAGTIYDCYHDASVIDPYTASGESVTPHGQHLEPQQRSTNNATS
jgi:hypothetical protein